MMGSVLLDREFALSPTYLDTARRQFLQATKSSPDSNILAP